MATGRPRGPAASTGRRRPRPKTPARAASALDKMAPSELAAVLRALLAKHAELRTEAEQIAVDMISSPSVDDVAEDVRRGPSLNIESFHTPGSRRRASSLPGRLGAARRSGRGCSLT